MVEALHASGVSRGGWAGWQAACSRSSRDYAGSHEAFRQRLRMVDRGCHRSVRFAGRRSAGSGARPVAARARGRRPACRRAFRRSGAGFDGRGEAALRRVRRRRRAREPQRRANRRHRAKPKGRHPRPLLRSRPGRRAHRTRDGLRGRLHARRRHSHEQPCRRGGPHPQRPDARRPLPAGDARRAGPCHGPGGHQDRRRWA